jgi:hypothetical protein
MQKNHGGVTQKNHGGVTQNNQGQVTQKSQGEPTQKNQVEVEAGRVTPRESPGRNLLSYEPLEAPCPEYRC